MDKIPSHEALINLKNRRLTSKEGKTTPRVERNKGVIIFPAAETAPKTYRLTWPPHARPVRARVKFDLPRVSLAGFFWGWRKRDPQRGNQNPPRIFHEKEAAGLCLGTREKGWLLIDVSRTWFGIWKSARSLVAQKKEATHPLPPLLSQGFDFHVYPLDCSNSREPFKQPLSRDRIPPFFTRPRGCLLKFQGSFLKAS